jgi:hypothetical protein
MADIQLKLSYSDLNALADRLAEISDTVRKPSIRGDIGLARFAVQDLASLRFGCEALVAEMNQFCERVDNCGLSDKVFGFAAELLCLLGYGEESGNDE